MTTSNGFYKMEVDSKIKPDPETQHTGMEDIHMGEQERYEPDEDLVMPVGDPRGMLIRLPRELWEIINRFETDDDNFQIGQVKVWTKPDGTETSRFEISESLLHNHPLIPRQYDMIVPPQPTKNTFIFSEKDRDNFKPRLPGRNQVAAGHDQLSSVDSKIGGPVKVEKPRQKYRIIPKRTAIVGGVRREYICSPRDNEEFRRIQSRKEMAEKGKHKVLTLLSGEAANALHTESMGIGGTADTYIRTAVEKKKRTQENKAIRMEEAPLTDMIINLYKNYRFYSMATLRHKTNQPESWLRQVMMRIGDLVKTGPAANTWTLKPLYMEINESLNGADGKLKDEALANIKTEQVAPSIGQEDEVESEEGEGADDEDMLASGEDEGDIEEP